MDVRQFLFLWVSVGVVCVLHAAEKPTPEVLDGIRLAHQFHAKRGGLFTYLPDDVVTCIVPQIHPRQTVDGWYSDAAVCIDEIKVPRKIATWDVRDDSLAYFSPTSETSYLLFRIDLVTVQEDCVTSNHGLELGSVPRLQLCQNKIVFEIGSCYGLRFIEKQEDGQLWTTSIADRSFNFACHATLPLCLSIGEDYGLRVHNMDYCEQSYLWHLNGFFGTTQDKHYFLAWHPTKPLFALSNNGWIRIRGVETIQRDGSDNNFEGKPCFTYNGDKIYGKNRGGLQWVAAENALLGEAHNQAYSDRGIKNSILEAVGDDYFLTRDDAAGSAFSLRSLKNNTVKSITSFNALKGKQYRLPDNHDYRLFVIDEVKDPQDEKNVHSIIKIYVPSSQARLEHLCLFKAALKAEETNRAVDWNLFAKADPTLLQKTAEYYVYFKYLMEKHNISVAETHN